MSGRSNGEYPMLDIVEGGDEPTAAREKNPFGFGDHMEK